MVKTVDRPKATTEGGAETIMRTPVAIDVTPLFRQGNTDVCSIESVGYMRGGSVRLPKGSYTLRFNLLNGDPANLDFEPDQNGVCVAFWSDENDCPRRAGNNGQYQNPRLVAPRILEVDVDVPQGAPPMAVHYRLNFNDNHNFDPIIIHD